MTEPIILTNPSQLPAETVRGITAPSFVAAVAEYERKYGAWAAAWYYRGTYFFEAKP